MYDRYQNDDLLMAWPFLCKNKYCILLVLTVFQIDEDSKICAHEDK